MMRGSIALAAGLATALALVSVAGAARGRESAVQPGTAIGNVRLGMTLEQVRAALGGRHQTVSNARTLRAGGRYVEFAWEKPGRVQWDPYVWTIGFQRNSSRAKLRAVRIASSDPRQKTPNRLGVGSRVRDVVRAYPEATCVGWTSQWRGAWIVVGHRNGAMTAFGVSSGTDSRWPIDRVLIQRNWIPFAEGGKFECDPGWRER